MNPILIVDDDQDICDSLKAVLSCAGYSAVTASNGLEAYDYITNNRAVSLMLLDLFMPLMKGDELLEQLQVKNLMPPTLIISAMSPWLTAKMLDYGVGYLRKPIDNKLLLNIINTLIVKEMKNEKTSSC